MLLGLELDGSERILCIGHAVGYPAALLSHLAREVHAIEIESALLEPERLLLAQLGRTNVTLVHADAVRGRHLAAPFQAILVTSAAPELPPALVEQLAIGGRIVIALGDAQGQLIEVLEKRVDTLVSRALGACCLPVFPSMLRTPSTFPWRAHHDDSAPRH
jgi:protein-L-isoaspartate(D-aspartate) O-methyltransferase